MISHAAFRQALIEYLPKNLSLSLNNDLHSGASSFPPSSVVQVADQCLVMAHIRDTRGDVAEPLWYRALAVIAKCTEGEPLAHAWSDGHKNYTPQETLKKFTQAAGHGPTTCKEFHHYAPALCDQCPHQGKIKSPITLGYAVSAITPAAAPDQSLSMPEGYRYQVIAPGHYRLEEKIFTAGDHGPASFDWVPICDTLYRPLRRLRTVEGMMLEMQSYGQNGKLFQIPCATVGTGGPALAAALATEGIVALKGHKMKPEPYLSIWMDKLRNDALDMASYKRFGWHGDNFLIGTHLLTPDGPEQVLCHGNASRKAHAFSPTGEYRTWKEVINTAYNRPLQEPLQYLVVLGFAAPLFSLFKELGGVTVYCYSEGSGVGKTTAQRAALSVWGDWEELQLADGKTTENALWGLVGTYCHLPVVFDELTNQSNEMASKVVSSVSSGRQRERMGADGELRENNANWSTILMASGNTMLTEKLSMNRNNPEAELSRAFEFTVHRNTTITPNEARDLFPKLNDHYGHAGVEYMNYVVQHRASVEQLLFALQKKFNTVVGITQAERYWSNLQASVLTALHICNRLGILQFDLKRLTAWIKGQVSQSRKTRSGAIRDPLETMGHLLDDLAQDILVTRGEGDRRKNIEALILHRPRAEISGRAIIAIDKSESDVLLVTCSRILDWCTKKGTSAKELFAAVVTAGWAKPDVESWSLGKGTTEYSMTGCVRCWVLDPQMMNAESAGRMVAQRLQLVLNAGVPHVQPTTPKAISQGS